MKGRERACVLGSRLGPHLVRRRAYQYPEEAGGGSPYSITPDDLEPLNPAATFQKRVVNSRPGLAQQAPRVLSSIQPVAHVLDYNYDVETVDLSVANSLTPLGLLSRGIVADSFTLTRVDAPLSFAVNSPTNKQIIASKGLFLGGFLISEMYVTNAAAVPGNLAQFVFLYDRRADSGISATPFGQY